MIYKNQISVFVVSFLIGGFFLLTFQPLSPNAYAAVCCVGSIGGVCAPAGPCSIEECPGSQSSPVCDGSNDGVSCTCPTPPPICCVGSIGGVCAPAGPCSIEECPGSQSSPVCDGSNEGVSCTCPTPPSAIPTLNQWGMIIMAGVLGLFAVIGLFVMRRGSVVKAGS
jgi:hypothetical protein